MYLMILTIRWSPNTKRVDFIGMRSDGMTKHPRQSMDTWEDGKHWCWEARIRGN